jgi:hypothetical protein
MSERTERERMAGTKPKDVHAPYDRKSDSMTAKARLEAEYAEMRTRSPGGRG